MTNEFRLHLEPEVTMRVWRGSLGEWIIHPIPYELTTEVIDSTDWCEYEEYLAEEEREYLEGESAWLSDS